MINIGTNLLLNIRRDKQQGNVRLQTNHLSVTILQEDRSGHAYAWIVTTTLLVIISRITVADNHSQQLKQQG